jgi:thiamine-monophosphate kinase
LAVRIDRLGEDRLIRLIQRVVGSRGRVRVGIGDDACVLRDGTVITTDAYADGVHFDLGYMSHFDVGRRCACAAISDVVAMAAEPEVVLVSLALRRDTTDSAVRAIYRGIESVCRRTGCEVAGGDVIALDRLVLSLTVAGRSRKPCLRSGARPGDTLYVTGHCGLAETGRLVLSGEGRTQTSGIRTPGRGRRKTNRGWRTAIERHLCPIPRIEAMRRLRKGIHALIDTSDGLATDCRHLGAMSRVRIELDAAAVPIAPATLRFCRGRSLDPTRFALVSGEDYELLFTAAPGRPAAAGILVTAIGAVKPGRGLFLRRGSRVLALKAHGYDHLMRP